MHKPYVALGGVCILGAGYASFRYWQSKQSQDNAAQSQNRQMQSRAPVSSGNPALGLFGPLANIAAADMQTKSAQAIANQNYALGMQQIAAGQANAEAQRYAQQIAANQAANASETGSFLGFLGTVVGLVAMGCWERTATAVNSRIVQNKRLAQVSYSM